MDHKCEYVSKLDILPHLTVTDGRRHRDAKSPEAITEQILTIAPILPGQTSDRKYEILPQQNNRESQTQAQPRPPPQKSAGNANLIDFDSDSRPPSAPPPTNNVQQKQQPAAMGLMDDDQHVDMMNDKMKELKMHEPITPSAQKPLRRTDTDTSEVDAFFDAET
jgi:oxysterol-binding protein-related protein 8